MKNIGQIDSRAIEHTKRRMARRGFGKDNRFWIKKSEQQILKVGRSKPTKEVYRALFGSHLFTVCNSSCGKVLFLHLTVILFTWGGVCLGRHPPRQTPPSGQKPPGRHPRADTRGHSPPGRHPPETATAVDGMHPTRMQSCYNVYFNIPHYQIRCLLKQDLHESVVKLNIAIHVEIRI